MPRRRMGIKGDGTNGSDRGAWGEIFTKTKMCKFNVAGQCGWGQACAFAHEPEELRPLPNLRLTKMCRAFRLSGFCEKADSCSFAHSGEEMRTSPAIVTTPEQVDPAPFPHEGRMSFDMGRLPDWLPPVPVNNIDLGLITSADLGLASDFGEGKMVAKTSTGSDLEMWSRQTTAQGTSTGWSRQTTTQEEDTKDMWNRNTFDDIEFGAQCAFKVQGLLTWQGPTESFDEDQGSRIWSPATS
eukprot:CAMPEP_0170606994 /NCGR_PEP_ID=MMETSP0224-20130122/20815_1 /TAXON_ID=285029 /ORGANISM="Togula jolla, Strain CCCM 725" /LENGTH=240 /DNA_ID=CAMNT_0010932125 /DNA_START=23 /DNA_END=745 /DNA_ORIENTATION=+